MSDCECAETGDVAFEPLWEVRDEQNTDQYFLDGHCVAVHNTWRVIDIKWFEDGKEMKFYRYV